MQLAALAAGLLLSAASALRLPVVPLERVRWPTQTLELEAAAADQAAVADAAAATAMQLFGTVARAPDGGAGEVRAGDVGTIFQLITHDASSGRPSSSIGVGRFTVDRVAGTAPCVTCDVTVLEDNGPTTPSRELALASAELTLWQAMRDVESLTDKLCGHLGGCSVDDDDEACVKRRAATRATAATTNTAVPRAS